MAFNTIVKTLQAMVNGRSRRLLTLGEVQGSRSIQDHTFLGRQTVALAEICGSASNGRCGDFDAQFRLRSRHTEERLESVIKARKQGKKLPPVTLIQLGATYFVEDGHHRISAARVLGDESIEGVVTLLNIAG